MILSHASSRPASAEPSRSKATWKGLPELWSRNAGSEESPAQADIVVAARPVMGNPDQTQLRRTEVVEQLLRIGVRVGGTLLVHTSFRAVRPIEGGPTGLIESLQTALGPAGTLVMPSWSGEYDQVFDPATAPADPDLGVVADTFWRLRTVLRSDHPFAFAAAGPAAEQILSDPLPLPPHRAESPVGRVHELDGQVLLLGVRHDANTTVHLAELTAGVPYRAPKYCTVLEDGQAVRVEYGENDHCCARFLLVDDWLLARALQSEGKVGHAQARLIRSRDVVAVTVAALKVDPLFFLHPSGICADCDEARDSIDSSDGNSFSGSPSGA